MTGIYFARDIDIYFTTVEEKNNFDKWFEKQGFEKKSVDEIVTSVENYLEGVDFKYGSGNECEPAEFAFIRSVYQYRFGDNWEEEWDA